MAEICCGAANEMSNCNSISSPEPREARRKRMQIRKFKLVSGMAGLPENCKRRKVEGAPSSSSASSGNDDTGSEVTDSSESSGSGNVATSSSGAPHPKVSVEIDRDVWDLTPKFGYTSVCGRRRDMEDAVAIHPMLCLKDEMNLHLFGVYDGHGCFHVAFNCRDRLHQLVKEEIAKNKDGSQWKEIMEKSFIKMDEEVLEWSRNRTESCRCDAQIPKCDAGSTAVVTVVTPEKIITANCGDSRAVLCRAGRAIPLSRDHKPDRPDELVRIQAAGGRVIYWDGPRVQGVLAMSRAIGDEFLRPYVIPDPEVTVTERTDEDECLILASDGLWDVLTSDMACNIARMCLNGQGPEHHNPARAGKMTEASLEEPDKTCSNAALLLTKLAMARNTSDNVSVIVVDLRRNM